MYAALGRGQNIATRLNRSCAQQNIPVGGPCWTGECRWDGEYLSASSRQPEIQVGKPHIVTDRHANTRDWRFDQRRRRPGAIAVRLAILFIRRGNRVEHVDLVVSRQNRPFRPDQEGAVAKSTIVRAFDRERSDQKPYAAIRGYFSQARECLIVSFIPQNLILPRAAHRDYVCDFGRCNQLSAALSSLANIGFCHRQIGVGIIRR